MGVPNVVYKWKTLRKLYISVFVMNVAGCVIVVIIIVSAIKLRMSIGQYLDLVIPGDTNFWPAMMFLIAFLCAPIYAIGIKLCFHLRFFVPDSLARLNKVLFIHCVLCFASMIIVIGVNAIVILHTLDFDRIIKNGIIQSMQEYATNVMAKVTVDRIQINFRCCGSKSFKDWFHVPWLQREGETPETRDRNESALLSTDVPFSCCATEILRPCIHHNILKPSEVYLYRPEHRLTIATTGCYEKVVNHARYVGGVLIVALTLLAFYQMILGLLSRLLQTAHSSGLYIGPRKGRYLAWILGSMPKTEIYHRLMYEDGDVPIEETASILDNRLSYEVEERTIDDRCGDSDNSKKKLSAKSSENLAVEESSSSTVTSQEEIKKSSIVTEPEEETSNTESDTNSIPTPPPSPQMKSIEQSKKSIDEKRTKIDVAKRKRCFSRGVADPNVNGSRFKELRKSLECLEKYQSPWKGGSPIFEATKSTVSMHQSKRGKNLVEIELERVRPSSGSSTEYKKHKVCGKDSVEEDEIRMKKFCKDLSTEYNKSPYSKQRRDFSEQYKCQDPIHQLKIRDANDGRMIRNEVCARFNPADTYSRFRGTLQDTMMRRSSQTNPGPPPIPITNQKPLILDARFRPRQKYFENPSFPSRPAPYIQISKPQCQILGPCRVPHQKLGWGPRCSPAPTYFPISSRPPRPPGLPPCSHSGSYLSYQQIQEKSCAARPLHFVQNESGGSRTFERCRGRCTAGQTAPRFSGC